MSAIKFTDERDYAKRLKILRKKSQSLLRNNESLRQHLPEVIQSILQRKRLQNNFNILSVGSSTGKSDFEILRIVKEELAKKPAHRQVKIFNRAVEPNGYSLKMYKAAFDEIPSLSCDEKLSLELCEKTFEEYKDEVERKEKVKFDIIHFVHCLYYMDIETTLVHCIEKELAEGGHIVSIVGYVEFDPAFEISVHLQSGSILLKKILTFADKQRLKYEAFAQEFFIDITDIFEEESEEGNLLVDFLMQVKEFRGKANPMEVKQALQAFKESSIEKDGKLFLNKVDNLVIIHGK